MLRVLLLLVLHAVYELCESSCKDLNARDFPEQYLFEGDILLRRNQKIWDKNAVTDKSIRWPEGEVPYLLDPAYDEDEKAIITSAMREIEKSTCIRFVAREGHEDFLGIYSGNGCWSSLGRGNGLQLLSLEKSQCIKKGVAMHELMHALGFLHEHTRPDRDDYLIIHWDNVIEEIQSNFKKVSYKTLDTLEEPYDYRSVMHYHAWAFAKDRSHPTLTPKKTGFSHQSLGYGQRVGILTDLDSRKIRKFYECTSYINSS